MNFIQGLCLGLIIGSSVIGAYGYTTNLEHQDVWCGLSEAAGVCVQLKDTNKQLYNLNQNVEELIKVYKEK